MRTVRTAARAVLLHEEKLLAVQMRGDDGGEFFVLPGGGQRHGESLPDALRREVLEEVGGRIDIGPVLYVRDYIGRNHAFSDQHRHFHQLEVVFRARLLNPEEVCSGQGCDNRQVGVCWLSLEEVAKVPLHPAILRKILLEGDGCAEAIYLGDIN